MNGSLNRLAPEIIKAGVFDNINKFSQLKQRISNTKSYNNRGIAKTKGDIFEIFCEAYLNVNQEYQTKKVYPQGYAPLSLLKKLNLNSEDDGWDGLYETIDGKYSIYQSKFRSNNENLKYQGKNGLSSTISSGQRSDLIHLIASTNKVSNSFTMRDKVIQTLETDLDLIEKSYFIKIEKWLKSKKYSDVELHSPALHQKEALKKIREEFKKNDRATIIMACGSGKTDIGIWVYKERNPQLALVLVPSIALVKQTRADWLSQLETRVMTFQLCSSKDISRQEDSLTVKEKDIDMQIETNPAILKKWLNKNKRIPKIIFSTYQSSKVLQKSLSKNKSIDFAVFDEAHRTASLRSNNESNFNFALHNENILIKKRLFMTATRRISNLSIKKAEGDALITTSMDNTQLFGNVCYNLSFTSAAKKYGCIAGLKVIISEVLSEEVNEYRRRKSATFLEGEKISSDYLAVQIAIKKTVEKYKLKKVFSFHNSIPKAEEFSTGDSPANIKFHLKEFYTNYIKGKFPIKKRDEILSEFKDAEKGLISNKRCLVEGVNVPEVDLVVFSEPKESEIDIVQSIGRALRNRNQRNKKFGYVLIPVFIEKNSNETIQDAVKRTNYEKVVTIIKAIKEHDDEIAQSIQEIIINKKRKKGKKRNKKIKLDFIENENPEISKKILFESIENQLVETISLQWDDMYASLLDYKEENKHLNILPTDKNYTKLYEWVKKVRRRYHNNKLFNFQIKELEEIGFKWYPDGVTLFDTKGLLNLTQLSNKFNISRDLIKKLIEKKIIVEVGSALSSAHVSSYYKNYSEEDLKKILEIDIVDTSKYFTAGELSKKLGFDSVTFLKKLSDTNIKPIGIGLAKNQGIKELKKNKYDVAKTYYYKNITKTEILKLFEIDFIKKKKTDHLLKSLRDNIYKDYPNLKTDGMSVLKKLAEDGKLEESGRGITSKGTSMFYKQISQQQFMNLTGITIIDTSKYFSENEFINEYNLTTNVFKKLLDNKIIEISGIGLSSTKSLNEKGFSTSTYFKKINKKKLQTYVNQLLDNEDEIFNKNLANLKKYKEKNNHVLVAPEEDLKLYQWLRNIRLKKYSGKKSNYLGRTKILKLEELGFDWKLSGETLEYDKQDEYSNIKELTELYGCNRNLVIRLIDEGKLISKGKIRKNFGLVDYYEAVSDKEFKKLLGITHFSNPDKKKFIPIHKVATNIKVSRRTLNKYLVETELLKPKIIIPSAQGVTEYFLNLDKNKIKKLIEKGRKILQNKN